MTKRPPYYGLSYRSRWILPVIVISQFCCTSLWFAGNGVMNDLVLTFHLGSKALAHLTSAVQLGFIGGTLVFALLSVADRFSPSKVFFWSALVGSICNLGIMIPGNSFASLLLFRFLTGFFLAGIYPVGMKIAADYYQKGLGTSLGYLVGALVIGTAFPHLLKVFTGSLSWQPVILSTSIFAIAGGAIVYSVVPDGPFRKPNMNSRLDLAIGLKVFKDKQFRSAAFGYFGHMWELYAFWTFIPLMLANFRDNHELNLNVPLWSFLIIGMGGVACVMGGYTSLKLGTKKTAFIALLLSCTCCLLSPWIFKTNSEPFFMGFLVFWGMVIIADSPLFSTLVAWNVIPEFRGTALTIVNCVGIAITIVSIQIVNLLAGWISAENTYVILALGPVIGLAALFDRTLFKLK